MKIKNYLNPLLKIAIPVVLSNIIMQIQSLIDKAFLGRLDPIYLSAVSNVSTPLWTTMSFCFSITIGASILISQRVGAKETDGVEELTASLFKWNNILPWVIFLVWMIFPKQIFTLMGVGESVLPLCVLYTRYNAPIFLLVGFEGSTSVIMQTSNYTKPLAAFGFIRALSNLVLDWVLIFGHFGFPAMGLKGAAIATCTAEYLGFAYATYVYVSSKQIFTRPCMKHVFKAKIRPYLKSIKLGINTAMEDFLWNLGNLLMIVILNQINEMAAAIYSIVFSIGLLTVVVVGAFGQGNMTLSSEAIGAKDKSKYIGVSAIAFVISECVILIVSAVCLIFPNQILGLFSSDDQFILACKPFMLLMCLNLITKVVNIIAGNSIRASGNPQWMFWTQVYGTFQVVGLACLFVFVMKMEIMGVFLAVFLDEAIRAAINTAKYFNILKKI